MNRYRAYAAYWKACLTCGDSLIKFDEDEYVWSPFHDTGINVIYTGICGIFAQTKTANCTLFWLTHKGKSGNKSFGSFLTIAMVPDCRWCDLGPTKIQRMNGICSSAMSQMTHCNLHVLFWERLVGEIQLSKAMAPFLSEHVNAFVWCHHDIAIEIQPPV